MKKPSPSIAVIILGMSLLLSSCAPGLALGPVVTQTPTLTQTPLPTHTPTSTNTPSPTPTLTPTPVSFQSAAGQKELSEIEVFGKGRIQLQDFSPDGSLYAAVVSRGIYLFDPASWEEITFHPLAPGLKVHSIAFSTDSSLFAAGDSEGNVTFRDTRTWEVTQLLKAHNSPVTSLDISPDKTKCVTIGDKKEIALWDLSAGTKIKSQVRAKDAGPVHYSFDGSQIRVSEATTYRDLTVWNAADLNFMDRRQQLGQHPPNIAVSPFTDMIAAFSFSDLWVYDFDEKKEIRFKDFFSVFDHIQMMVFPDPSTLIIKKQGDDNLYRADLKTKQITQLSVSTAAGFKDRNPDMGLITKVEEIQALGFTPFSKIQSITRDDGALILSDGLFDLNEKALKNQAVLKEYDWSRSFILANGNIAVLNASEPSFPNKVKQGTLTIITLDPQDYVTLSRQKIDFDITDGIQDIALSPDGSILAAGLIDGNMYLWDVNTGEQLANIRAHNKVYEIFGFYSSIKDIIFSTDGSLFITVGFDKTIKVWRAADFSLVSTVYGSMAAFSPDGANLAYVDSYNRIQIQSLLENTPPVLFDGHTQDVTGLLFSVDGSLVVSGSRDQTVKIWSIADQALLSELPQSSPISSMVLSPDGTRLYTRTNDGVISVWGYGAP